MIIRVIICQNALLSGSPKFYHQAATKTLFYYVCEEITDQNKPVNDWYDGYTLREDFTFRIQVPDFLNKEKFLLELQGRANEYPLDYLGLEFFSHHAHLIINQAFVSFDRQSLKF